MRKLLLAAVAALALLGAVAPATAGEWATLAARETVARIDAEFYAKAAKETAPEERAAAEAKAKEAAAKHREALKNLEDFEPGRTSSAKPTRPRPSVKSQPLGEFRMRRPNATSRKRRSCSVP